MIRFFGRRRMRFYLLFALACACPARAEAPPEPQALQGTITADATWSGAVRVAGSLSVGAGVVLTIAPGTTILFSPAASLVVAGTLRAEGTPERPIVFQPAAAGAPKPGQWEGLTLSNEDSPSLLLHCRISGARAIAVTGGSHRIAQCELTAMDQGVVVSGRGTSPTIENNRLSDLARDGVECSLGSAPTISGNRIERCGGIGVSAERDALPKIVGNRISGCDTGIDLQRTAPAIRDNELRGNRRGLTLNLVSAGHPIQGNTVAENELGILCENFSSPVITGNLIEKNNEGLICFQSSRPLVESNRIVGNGVGLVSIQISSPLVRGNLFQDNDRAVYLHLSSYAVIHENDFDRNRLHIELGNMSSDWERRVRGKPSRGRLQQTVGRLREAGGSTTIPGPPPPEGADGAIILDHVDATNNWWGEATTREMEAKGADADISGIVDFHDVPTRVYDADPVEYVQDRVRYSPWARAAFGKATAVPGKTGESDAGR